MSKTWIVVADSSRARLFAREKRGDTLQPLDDMLHPEGRLRASEELSDRQGGIAGGHGQGDFTFEQPTDVKHHDAEVFAAEIAEKLEHGRIRGEFQDLVLVAPPAFLGILRQCLDVYTSRMVSKSVNKHLVDHGEADILAHL